MDLFIHAAISLLLIAAIEISVIVPVWITIYYFGLDYLSPWLRGIIASGVIEAYKLVQSVEQKTSLQGDLRPYATAILLTSLAISISLHPNLLLQTVVWGCVLGIGIFSSAD